MRFTPYHTPQGGVDFRLTDGESGANAKSGRSVGVVRKAAGVDKGEGSSGSNIPQPIGATNVNQRGIHRKKRILTLINRVMISKICTLNRIAENLTAINILFRHQFNGGIKPSTSSLISIRNRRRKILPMIKNVARPESVVDSSLYRCQTFGIHLRASITIRRDVGIIHDVRVQTRIWNNSDMMRNAIRVASVVIAIKRCDAPIHTTNRPVITDVHRSQERDTPAYCRRK